MDIFKEWEAKIKKSGKSISEIARLAGVDRSVIERYKNRIPKPVEIYLKVEKIIKSL